MIPQRYRRTDGWTTCLGSTALRVASRGKNQATYDSSAIQIVFTYLLTYSLLKSNFANTADSTGIRVAGEFRALRTTLA